MNRFSIWLRAMRPWNRSWVWLGLAIVAAWLAWEFVGAYLEWRGITEFPTLSRIIVGTIPLPILIPLTLVIAVILCWHWVVTRRNELN